VRKVQLDNGVKCWAFSSSQYVQAAVKNVEEYLSKRDDVNWKLLRRRRKTSLLGLLQAKELVEIGVGTKGGLCWLLLLQLSGRRTPTRRRQSSQTRRPILLRCSYYRGKIFSVFVFRWFSTVGWRTVEIPRF
jgi:hypothetical protein